MKNAPVVRTANRPTMKATQRSGHDRQRKREVRAAAHEHRQAGEHIAADTEQAGMAEGDQPAGRQEIEAQREDRQDRGFGDQLLREEAGEGLRDQRHDDERDANRPADEGAARHHQPDTEKRRAGISPLGRKMRTSAMTR